MKSRFIALVSPLPCQIEFVLPVQERLTHRALDVGHVGLLRFRVVEMCHGSFPFSKSPLVKGFFAADLSLRTKLPGPHSTRRARLGSYVNLREGVDTGSQHREHCVWGDSLNHLGGRNG